MARMRARPGFFQQFVAPWVFTVAVIVSAVAAAWAFTVNGCENACEANGDEAEFIVGNGCYCRDDAGIYNPRDSRGDR